jgi:hypothetical protein
VYGAGTTETEHSYFFYDRSPGDGVQYYRLQQVDFNGDLSYSDIIAVDVLRSANVIHIYPNPTSSVCTITETATNGIIIVVNDTGQEVFRCQGADGNTSIDISKLPAGLYMIWYVSNGRQASGNVVKY